MKLEIIGTFYNNHSLSIVNRNLALELAKNEQIELIITPLDLYDPAFKVDIEQIKLLKQLEVKDFGEIPPDVQIRHTYPPIWKWPTSDRTKVVYIQPWEFSKIPFEWQTKFEAFADLVITPSKWTGDKFLDAGLKPSKLKIIPNGYNPDIFNTTGNVTTLFNQNKLNIIYVGCSQYRKGLDLLLNSWHQIFKKADNVRLIIKDNPRVYGVSNVLDEVTKMQFKSNAAEVIYLDDDFSDKEMAEIYRGCQVIIHPYRGEGFGMHIQEAMACGVLPVVTRGGPTDEFVSPESGILLSTRQIFVDLNNKSLMIMKPGDSFTSMSTHTWVLEPDIEDIKRQLFTIYRSHERDNILNKVKNAKLTNWNTVGNQYAIACLKLSSIMDQPQRVKTFS